jgi:hypothetical protein
MGATKAESKTKDELAGVVDLFGTLTRDELTSALAELAFKQGKEVNESAFDSTIAAAVTDYYLVETECETTDGARADALVPGPVAFPMVPENGEDLPHIMDVPNRSVDRGSVGEAVAERLRDEAEAAVESGDEERARYLLDVSYDVEAWAPVAVGGVRERLDDALDE